MGKFRTFRTSAFVAAFTFLIVYMPLPVSAAGNAIVSVSAPPSVVAGSQFTISINVQPNNAIAGAQFNLAFNSSLVTVNSLTEGNLFKQNGASTYFMPGQINNTAGSIAAVACVVTSPGQTVSAAGTLATISMTAKSSEGTCPLTLSSVVVGNINGQSIATGITNSQITIGNGTNQPPVLGSIGNKSAVQGQNISFYVSASDPNNDSLTYTASNLPSGATFNSLTRIFSWTPNSSQSGVFPNIRFTVSDGTYSVFEEISITITVSSPAPAPVSGGGGGGPTKSADPFDLSSSISADGTMRMAATLRSSDGNSSLFIPPGTKTKTVDGKTLGRISLEKATSLPVQSSLNVVGFAYDFGPDGTTFDPPINLAFTYSSSPIPAGYNEQALVLAAWDDLTGSWTVLDSVVDPEIDLITAKISHFSVYAIIPRPAPAALSISKLTAEPVEIYLGDTALVNVVVSNTGDVRGTSEVVFSTPGNIMERVEVTVDGKSSKAISFSIAPGNSGNFEFDVNGLSGSLRVLDKKYPGLIVNDITVPRRDIYTGEVFSIAVSISNLGNAAITQDLPLLVNGRVESTKSCTVAPGLAQEIYFEIKKDSPGLYELQVDDSKTTFNVQANPKSDRTAAVFSWAVLGQIIGIVVILIGVMVTILFIIKKKMAGENRTG